ncbi:MAG: CocE/NonD family hydrolase [Sulfobacillus sp.]
MTHRHDFRPLLGLKIPMRDGVGLAADIYLPVSPGAHPVVLLRTPYLRTTSEIAATGAFWARAGYVFVAVDVRGRGDSEGAFRPYRAEGEDGFDAIEWCAAQSFSSGAVGTIGASYSGKIQWQAALQKPPHLQAMVSVVPPSDAHVESPTGAPSPMSLCWLHLVSGHLTQNLDLVDWEKVYWHLPLASMDQELGAENVRWQASCTPSTPGPSVTDYQRRMDELDLPALHISGWYDDEQIGTPLNYRLMSQRAASERGRSSQRLLIGPWGHRVNQQKLGAVDFGPSAVIELDDIMRQFFDRHLKGAAEDGWAKPVRIFMIGDGWREIDQWPPGDMTTQPLYLTCTQGANSRFGDGQLSPTLPAGSSEDHYLANPLDPVPFLTEALSHQIGGADDYRVVEERQDLLVYTSATLREPVDLLGPVRVVVHVACNVRDLDVMAKLLDVFPDGRVERVVDGMVRGRYRQGMGPQSLLEPGSEIELDIDLWNVGRRFAPGHAIRLEIASSAHPKYPRNLHTGGDLARETADQAIVAEVRLLHGPDHPSRILLPVVRGRL